MTSSETALTAAFIGSSSGWAGFYLAVRSNRRALNRQTDELKTATVEQTEDLRKVSAKQTTELKEHIAAQSPAPEP